MFDLGLIIKILAAVCACTLAIIPLRFKTVSSDPTKALILGKLTQAGTVCVFAAIGVFIFAGYNEILVKKEQDESKVKLQAISSNLETTTQTLLTSNNKLKEYETFLSSIMKESLRSRNALKLLLESSYGDMRRIATISLTFQEHMANIIELRDNKGSAFNPEKGDEVHWRIRCLREIPDPKNYASAPFRGRYYGDFVANWERLKIDSPNDFLRIDSTLATGSALYYEIPASEEYTHALAMAKCSIKIDIKRDVKQIQLGILSNANIHEFDTGDPFDSSLCQEYKLRTGQSCKDLVN